jgi:hypothetical protein
MNLPLPNETTVRNAVTQWESLWQLEQSTGTKTNRSRNAILQSLSDSDLIAVAVILKNKGYTSGGAR